MKEKILIVDDEVEVANTCVRLLEETYDVTTANAAEQALELCKTEGPFHVVISDEVMPGMTGRELLERFRSEYPQTVRILISGHPDCQATQSELSKGEIFRSLAKPFTASELNGAVDEGIELYRTLTMDMEAARARRDNRAELEQRVEQQSAILKRMHQFATDLNKAASLDEIAAMAAKVACEVLSGRGTHVQIWDLERAGIGVESGAGPEMSCEMYRKPLITHEGQIGEIVVDVNGPQETTLTDSDHGLLNSIASSTAVAARNEFGRRERDRAQHATIVALARLAEQRDNETGAHLERVSLYCKLLAEGLRQDGFYVELITDAWIEDLVRSSPLHDIGKVGIPDSILLKPGKLTPEEWVIMKTHAEIGATTIDSVIKENPDRSFLKMARDIAWCHHEKVDGSGYPRGLKGEEIPLSARILTLADVYDALTSVRPYKNAWTHEEAMEWIGSYAGTHFDTRIVNVLVREQVQANRIRERLADKVEQVAER